MSRCPISKGFIKRLLLTLGTLAFIAGLCVIDGLYIEPYFPRVIRQEVFISDLPKSLDGLKIVQLSDLHIVQLGKREERAIKKIKRIEPDIICLTGDYIDDDGITPGEHRGSDIGREACRFVEQLHAKHGIYGVMGNWDALWLKGAFEDSGVQMLDDGPAEVEIDGARIRLASDCPRNEARVKPTIVLQHVPPEKGQLRAMDGSADLVLSGHWHGGQVCKPFHTVDADHVAGLYREGTVNLYVTRGLGMHSEAVRFMCPAEITLIILKRK